MFNASFSLVLDVTSNGPDRSEIILDSLHHDKIEPTFATELDNHPGLKCFGAVFMQNIFTDNIFGSRQRLMSPRVEGEREFYSSFARLRRCRTSFRRRWWRPRSVTAGRGSWSGCRSRRSGKNAPYRL